MRKPYRQPQRWHWWWHHGYFRRYMLREATALPLFVYSLVLMSGLYRFTQGPRAFALWLEAMQAPGWLVFHGLALAACLLHTVTWLELVPKILVVHGRRVRISGTTIKRVHQGAAVVGSLALVAAAALHWPLAAP